MILGGVERCLAFILVLGAQRIYEGQLEKREECHSANPMLYSPPFVRVLFRHLPLGKYLDLVTGVCSSNSSAIPTRL